MFSFENLSAVLRGVAAGLQRPVMLLLIVLIAAAVVLVGTLVAEIFTERLRLRVKLPRLVDDLRAAASPAAVRAVIEESGLLRRQREALLELTRHPEITAGMREALALRLYEAEKERYAHIVRLSDLITRLGPMLGLLGTLIPLGPGIIALGRGDTYTLSVSLMTAFDTTIAGLAAAACAFLVSALRRGWYAHYMATLEMCLECVLEQSGGEERVGSNPRVRGKDGGNRE
ncbi:MAG: MotA/TolQ/ExbB proton channel family protein [Gracilibacteraceae bacterium]|jgi:biopolymer transport protein ExbB/TolQ|nr:MotA/TolQ/ExbB proton channel family protein [Gracilibacteraceae bacterium]